MYIIWDYLKHSLDIKHPFYFLDCSFRHTKNQIKSDMTKYISIIIHRNTD